MFAMPISPEPYPVFFAVPNFKEKSHEREQEGKANEPEEHDHLSGSQSDFVWNFTIFQDIIRAHPFAVMLSD